MENTEKRECPKGKVYTYRDGSKSRKRHLFKVVSRVRYPKDDKRGHYHCIEECQYCGERREWDGLWL